MRLALVFLALVGAASADQWTFFHPELVSSYSCKVQDVTMQAGMSAANAHQVWEAEALAERKGEDQWVMTIGEYEHTVKGRHQAEKVCSKWMDEASKRVKGNTGGKQ